MKFAWFSLEKDDIHAQIDNMDIMDRMFCFIIYFVTNKLLTNPFSSFLILQVYITEKLNTWQKVTIQFIKKMFIATIPAYF